MNPLLARSFLVGVLILSTAYGASALTVKRTNQLIDGAYVPVLIVKHNGETHIHRVGEDGLTRTILFNRAKALAWARAKYGIDGTDLTASGNGPDYAGGHDGDDDMGSTG